MATGLRKTFTLELDNDTTVGPFTTSVADVLRWEAKNGKSWFDDGTVTQFVWIAWAAARRLHLIPDEWATFDAFMGHLVDYTLAEEPDPDPTPTTPGDDA